MPTSQINIAALRISRARPDGTPDYGNETGALVFVGGIMSIAHAFTTQSIAAIFEVDGDRRPLLNEREKVVTTGTTLAITMGRSDFRLDEIFGGELVMDNGNIVGSTSPTLVGCDVDDETNVIVEYWSRRRDCATPADPPFIRHVEPLLEFNPEGYTNENGLAQIPFNGVGRPNPNIGEGPFLDLPDTSAHKPWTPGKFLDVALPTQPDPFDYVPLPDGS